MLSLPNVQPPEKQDLCPDGSLEVVDVFKTIQGEGPLAGTPAIFVRLAGCSTLCPGCDTDYTSNRTRYHVDELVQRIMKEEGESIIPLVVLTGGEPFRQNITPLVEELIYGENYNVQIETNGMLYVEKLPLWNSGLSIVCSPKSGSINIRLTPSAYKYVITDGAIDPEDGLPTSVLGLSCKVARPPGSFPKGMIFVQPADEQDAEKNKRNLQATLDSCFKFGYRLSLQTHKTLGLK